MNIRPLSNNLLVRRAAPEESRGGIILPGTAQKKPHRGTVVAVGPGYRTDGGVLVETTCRPEDLVIFADGIGVEIDVAGETLLMLSEDTVIAIVEAV